MFLIACLMYFDVYWRRNNYLDLLRPNWNLDMCYLEYDICLIFRVPSCMSSVHAQFHEFVRFEHGFFMLTMAFSVEFPGGFCRHPGRPLGPLRFLRRPRDEHLQGMGIMREEIW